MEVINEGPIDDADIKIEPRFVRRVGERIDPTNENYLLDKTGVKRYESKEQLAEEIKRLTEIVVSTDRALEEFYATHTESTKGFMNAVRQFARSSAELERALRLFHGLFDRIEENSQ